MHCQLSMRWVCLRQVPKQRAFPPGKRHESLRLVRQWVEQAESGSEHDLSYFLRKLANLECNFHLFVLAWAVHCYRNSRHTDHPICADIVCQMLRWADANIHILHGGQPAVSVGLPRPIAFAPPSLPPMSVQHIRCSHSCRISLG